MKRYILVFFLFISFSGYSQNTINNYKFVIVPEKYSFQKQNDQYSLNSLTKFLLQDKGFTVYLDNAELPTEIANNKCRALSADLLEKGGMFTTSITFILKDCQGNIVFKSKEGKSREKEYNVAYNMALRDAFSSLDGVKYAYVEPSANEASAPAQAAVTTAPVVTAEPAKQVAATTAAATRTVKATAGITTPVTGTLYAQAIANGYQLIDTTPKIVLTLLKTSAENYYIASNATANGIVLKKNQDWFFEYYKDGVLVSDKLQVKF
jgi:biotin carboxyl carrier protein